MTNQTTSPPKSPSPEKPPKWLQEFKERVSLFEVAYKAFDPNISDKEIREELKKAAKSMEGMQMPGAGSTTP